MKARIYQAAIAASLLIATIATPHAKEWKTVTIATEGAYAPWNLTKPDGSLDGFEIELGKDLCGRMKVTCKFVAQDWDGMIAGLNARKFDVIMDGVAITDERRKVIDFSRPYASTPGAFAGLRDGPLATLAGTGSTVILTGGTAHDKPTLDGLRAALQGKNIGIQTSTAFTKFVEDNFSDIATITEYKTASEHDLDLVAGRIDVAFDDVTYILSALSRSENAQMMIVGPQISGPIWGEGEAAGFRKDDADLRALFDKALASAIADGTVKDLSIKWFKIDITPAAFVTPETSKPKG
ncbi:transporter substrate-binding domain-containing protein [Labrys sp. KNU-23]|uniref:transporter substrate-binding domain-containing protein n=1 Tax=Labrys sp. KNU-23 TaxID=2789216 RepID=UPI0011F09828|nr:transporter substrate-binding domain-containing protein [Labrys sp. KNU-23]QEN85299.1 transporter substrate-binding domain-containing protein [Labrys sp. KNU-23]